MAQNQRRLDLQTLFETLLGSAAVYFQPPKDIEMVYPCIVYSRSGINTKKADNQIYFEKTKYMVTVIDRNPDSLIPTTLLSLAFCGYERHFISEGLHHDVLTLYY